MFLLRDGGVYPLVFWLGQIVVGSLAPACDPGLIHRSARQAGQALMVAATLFLIGGLCQMYVIIIGGQAYPLDIFPGLQVSSSFFDGEVARYVPSLPEVLLGISGISLAMLLAALALQPAAVPAGRTEREIATRT